MIHWSINAKSFDLQYNWKLSRNETTHKTNLFVKISDGEHHATGEVAPNIRYLETVETSIRDFDYFKQHLPHSHDPFDFENEVLALPVANSVKFGITSAYFHLIAAQRDLPVHKVLRMDPVESTVKTCYTIPIMAVKEIEAFYENNGLQRFNALKIKVEAGTSLAMIKEIARITDQCLYIDANEAWNTTEALFDFASKVHGCNIGFLEQPFPVNFVEGYKYVKGKLPYPVVADESVIGFSTDFDSLAEQFDGVNMKLQKAGGYGAGMAIIKEAKKRGMLTMIGCMVESTLGIGGAMMFAPQCDYVDLDGFLLIKMEPYNLIKENGGSLMFNSIKF